MTVGSKKTLSSRTMSVGLTLWNKGRSPRTILLVSFLSMVVLCLLLHRSKATFIRQHLPRQLCKSADQRDIEVVVAVKSSPSNYANRQAIRNTMASPAVRAVLPWHVVFYMGYSQDLARSRELRREVLKGDLIITNYEDHVRNTVNSFINTIRWVHERCSPKLRYFIHTNDSTMVNLVAAHEFISGMTQEDRYFHCVVKDMVAVDRNVNSSTYVSEKHFGDSVFPTFCEGDAFIVHARFLKPLVLASETIPQYPLLGPYVTGHLPAIARVGHKNISIGVLDSQPLASTCGPTQRMLFTTNVTVNTQWKPLWLNSLVCNANQNSASKQISEKILNGM